MKCLSHYFGFFTRGLLNFACIVNMLTCQGCPSEHTEKDPEKLRQLASNYDQY